jgi:hypothetical protein
MEKTREQWLQEAVVEFRALAAERAGVEVPEVAVSVGFPSRGAGGRGNAEAQVIGQCHYVTGDGRPAIFIHPVITDPVRVLDILLHELLHAALPKHSHNRTFAKAARDCGLDGKPTATVAGKALKAELKELAAKLGEYHHGKVSVSAGKKQTTRLLKVECGRCGYIVRTTEKWLAVGTPTCPCGERMREV